MGLLRLPGGRPRRLPTTALGTAFAPVLRVLELLLVSNIGGRAGPEGRETTSLGLLRLPGGRPRRLPTAALGTPLARALWVFAVLGLSEPSRTACTPLSIVLIAAVTTAWRSSTSAGGRGWDMVPDDSRLRSREGALRSGRSEEQELHEAGYGSATATTLTVSNKSSRAAAPAPSLPLSRRTTCEPAWYEPRHLR